MKNINNEEYFWKKLWVSGLVMLPSYLMLAIVSSNIQGWWWVLSVVVGLWLIGNVYVKAVLQKKILKKLKMHNIAFFLFFLQVAVILLLYFIRYN